MDWEVVVGVGEMVVEGMVIGEVGGDWGWIIIGGWECWGGEGGLGG